MCGQTSFKPAVESTSIFFSLSKIGIERGEEKKEETGASKTFKMVSAAVAADGG